jgi:hypothetical protein
LRIYSKKTQKAMWIVRMAKWRWKIGLLVTCLSVGSFAPACSRDATEPRGQRRLVTAASGISGEQWRQDFTFADMDGDGVKDLITAPPRKSKEPWPHIFLHRQDRWEPVTCPGTTNNGFPPKEYAYGGVAVADFSGDGKLDIALAVHEEGLRLFYRKDAGLCGPWEEQPDLPKPVTTFRSRAIASVDMNRDGRTDIVILSEAPQMNGTEATAGIGILWNTANGWQLETITGSEGLFGDDLSIGEVNGDGIPDIAVGSLSDTRPQFLWLSDGNGHWQPASAEGLPSNMLAWSVQLADFDSDGKDELLLGVGGAPVYKNGGPRVYRWDGARWHDLSQGLPQIFWVGGVHALDLNGDGKKEIVAAALYEGIVKVYRQGQDRSWVEDQELQIPDAGKLRNYKVRSFAPQKNGQPLVVANYADDENAQIITWAWQ